MKRVYWIFMLSFLFGVFLGNLLWSESIMSGDILNRYNLRLISFRGPGNENYFVTVLLMRVRVLILLWLLSKMIRKNVLVRITGILFFIVTGILTTMLVVTNGVWGILFMISSFFPHIIIYATTLGLWNSGSTGYASTGRKIQYVKSGLVIVLFLAGVLSESFISPLCVEFILKI